jgi:quercetin dioxygenase-like cupin family protein
VSNIFNTPETDLDYGRDMSSDVTAPDPADALRAALGQRLLGLRRRSGKTLREAAKLADLSPAFVSLVERGQTEIGLSRLIRLADAYDANIADLLAEIHGREVEYVPAAEALTAPRSQGDPKVTYLTSPSWQIQPFRIEIDPGASLESLAHAGEEFIHCVAGAVEMTIAGRAWILEAGDTIVVPPRSQHAYRNHGDVPAVVVGAVAPPNRPGSAPTTNDRR